MATWLYPPAFVETFRCDYCECDFEEDDLTQYERNKWACDACARANDEEAAALQEMADDDAAEMAFNAEIQHQLDMAVGPEDGVH